MTSRNIAHVNKSPVHSWYAVTCCTK